MEQQRFKINDLVQWESQAQGCYLTKTGRIVQVVPPGKKPNRDAFPDNCSHRLEVGCFARDHESYVVLVGRKLYWPRVQNLQKRVGDAR